MEKTRKPAPTQTRKNDQRQRRLFNFEARRIGEGETDSPELWVEGYAVRFDSPTVLFEENGLEYYEQIDPKAFEGCNLSDVIFNYNHMGRVMARTRNKTLTVEVRDIGLFTRARLDGTPAGREMFEEIQKGYIDKMSFTFLIDNGGDEFDPITRTWTVRRIKRLFDVSAVDIPAYDDTSIAARRADAARAALEHRKAAEAATLAQRVRIRAKATKATIQNMRRKQHGESQEEKAKA